MSPMRKLQIEEGNGFGFDFDLRNMPLPFTKMHSLGNDFVLIDAVSAPLEMSASLATALADRHRGVGCDQVLVVEPPVEPDVDFRLRVFNADGSEAGQCGNGARCVARFLRRRGLTDKDRVAVSTDAARVTLELLERGAVRVDMGEPVFEAERIPFVPERDGHVQRLSGNGAHGEFGVLSMGNPHAVMVVDDVATVDVAGIGAGVAAHPAFPERANVGFMQVLDRRSVRLRVFERGVGETRACGSGACAAVVSGRLRRLLDAAVEVRLPGGRLRVEWRGMGAPVFLTGGAARVFDGEYDPCPEP